MKKLLLLLLIPFLGMMTTVEAQNTLSMPNYQSVPGGTLEVGVNLDNTDPVVAFQLDIPVGENLTYVDGSCALTARASENHELTAQMVGDVLRVLVYSLPIAEFTGNTGDIITLSFNVGDATGTFPLPIENAVISNADAQALPLEVVAGSFTVEDDTPANNVLSIAEYSGASGETIEVGVNMDNQDLVAGVQFDVVFPSEITYVEGSCVLTDRKSPSHMLVAQMVSETTLRVLSYAMPADEFSGNTGDVVTFQVILGETEGNYPLQIENAVLSDKVGTPLGVSTVDGNINIGGTPPSPENNVLSIGEYVGEPGQTIEVGVNMDNQDLVAGVQFDVVFPSEITYVEGSCVLTDRKSPSHMLVAQMVSETTLRVLSYAMPADEFSGNTGDVVTFQVILGETEGNYPLQIENAVLSDKVGTPLGVSTVDGNINIGGTPTPTYTVNATVNPANAGTVIGTGEYVEGQTATLVATANANFAFENWTENGEVVATTATYTFDVVADRELVANFTESVVSGNTLSIGQYNGIIGQTVVASVALANEDAVAGLQFDIPLDENLVYVDGSMAFTERATADHEVAASMVSNNTLRVIVYSMPATPFTGNSGDILTFALTLGAEAGVYDLSFENVILSDVDANSLPVDVVDGNVTIELPEMYEITASVYPSAGGTVEGTGVYAEATEVTLTAIANDGFAFVNWTEEGTVVSEEAAYTFVVESDRALVANFTADAANILSIGNYNGEAGETVTIGVNMENTDVIAGIQFDIVLPAEVTYVEGTAALTDRASATHILVAQMVNETTLRVLTYAMPLGEFSGNDGDVFTFDVVLGNTNGTYPVQLTEAVLSDIVGTTLPVASLDGTIIIGGTPQPTWYTVAATVNPADAGSVTGAGEYEEGTTATLVATANAGYMFQNWTENNEVVATTATYSFEVLANRNLVANFVEASGNILSIGNYNGQAGETVTVGVNMANVDVVAGIQFDIVLPAEVTYVEGTAALTDRASATHILVAQMVNETTLRVLTYAMPLGEFSGNDGDVFTFDVVLGNTNGTYPVQLTEAVLSDIVGTTLPVSTVDGTITIGGTPTPNYIVTAEANPANAGTVAGAGEYAAGAIATLTATANEGYVFQNWMENGAVVSTSATYTFVVNADHNLVANFMEISGNVLVLGNYIGQAGGTVTLGVNMINEDAIAGIQFDILLPAEATYVEGSAALTDRASANHVLVAQMVGESTLRVLSYAMPIGEFSGNNGDVFTFDVVLGDVDGTYPVQITEAVLSDVLGTTLPVSTVDGSVTISSEQFYTITAVANPVNAGTITGAGNYSYGDEATLVAVADSHYEFVNWTENGQVVSTNAAYTFTVTANRNLVANFVATSSEQFTINLTASPIEGGHVAGGGVYMIGETITVTATANTGYTFFNWTENGNVVSQASSYTFAVNSDRNLVANFNLKYFTVTAMAEPSYGGTVTGGGMYQYGTNATLSAAPAVGYVFEGWKVNGQVVSTDFTYTFPVTADVIVIGSFVKANYTLALVANPSSAGTLYGAGVYEHGTTVTAEAEPTIGYEFVSWIENGSVVSQNEEYTFTMVSNRTLVANFQLMSFEIEATASPASAGSVSGAGTYMFGETATLIATANNGYHFVNWTIDGDEASTKPEFSFQVVEDYSFVANFELNVYNVTLSATPQNAGTVSGAGEYEHGDDVTVVATANDGYKFVRWMLNGQTVSEDASYTFEIICDLNLVAEFAEHIGIEDLAAETTVYPNPATDFVKVNCEGMTSIKILSGNGVVVNAIDMIENCECTIDLGAYGAGTYIIHIETPAGVITKKVVKM